MSDAAAVEREYMEYDVVIVGGGPAGLSAAIRLRQLSIEQDVELSVCVLEKGSEIGAHILSGAVMDPTGISELIPDWKEKGAPLNTPVTDDRFYVFGPAGALRIPNLMLPPLMSNHGNYICSLSNVTRWLGEQAEALGAEIYPGFACAEVLYNDDGSVRGVATGDLGVGKDGAHKDTYQPGFELRGKYTLIAEGARGSLAKQLIEKFELDKDSDHQKYGIGLKEIWDIDPARHHEGRVMHSFGWPLGNRTGGGCFLYHMENNQVSIGFVLHLNYENPHISPFDEFQRLKHHPMIKDVLEGGRRVAYGARAITEGGYQSVPKLGFPGGALIGCSAGFVNVPRIKGSAAAIKTGMMGAEAAFEAVKSGNSFDEGADYEAAYNDSWVRDDLYRVRNSKPFWSKFGLIPGLGFLGIDLWMNNLRIGLPFTLKHGKPDSATLKPASKCKKIEYPKPDGVLSFDKPSSVYLSATNHEEDQPCHLTLADDTIPIKSNLPLFDEPAQRFCPAGVYEVMSDEDGSNPQFVINAQNCVHCKTCDIKDPAQNINWTVPEGTGGPNYPNM